MKKLSLFLTSLQLFRKKGGREMYLKVFLVMFTIFMFSVGSAWAGEVTVQQQDSPIVTAQIKMKPKPMKPKPSRLDCKWKCDEKKKECVCYGKDCQTCTGKKTKAIGGVGRVAIKVSFEVCTTKCFWECTGSIDNQCVEWTKTCITVCRQ